MLGFACRPTLTNSGQKRSFLIVSKSCHEQIRPLKEHTINVHAALINWTQGNYNYTLT